MINNLKEILDQEFHDACGIGFIAELSAIPSRRTIDYSIEALKNMAHRGASGADERTSDGTGLLQIFHTNISKWFWKMS